MCDLDASYVRFYPFVQLCRFICFLFGSLVLPLSFHMDVAHKLDIWICVWSWCILCEALSLRLVMSFHLLPISFFGVTLFPSSMLLINSTSDSDNKYGLQRLEIQINNVKFLANRILLNHLVWIQLFAWINCLNIKSAQSVQYDSDQTSEEIKYINCQQNISK